MADQLEVAREALAQIGTRSKIASLDDGSAEATYINLLYMPIRDFLLTDGDYDFSMITVALTNVVSVPGPWTYMYEWPDQALRIRQLIPKDYNQLDPRPVTWNVTQLADYRWINTHVEMSSGLFTYGAVEDLWDGIFRQSFVRMLASALAFALENRIEASKVKLDEALGFAGVGKMRDS